MSAVIEAEPTAPALTPTLPSAGRAGTSRLAEDEGTTLFLTDPTDLDIVSRALLPQLPPCCRPSY
jgi:hypothetical protein